MNFRSRYLAVTQPLIYSRRRRSKRLAGLMIVAVWVLAGAITSPPLLGCFPRATNRDIKKCSYNMDSSYVIFSAMGSFFLPMLVMLYVYGRISCVIASRHRNLEATESENVRPRRNVLVSIKDIYSICFDSIKNILSFFFVFSEVQVFVIAFETRWMLFSNTKQFQRGKDYSSDFYLLVNFLFVCLHLSIF